jgi:hypothetical protein
MLYVLYAKCCFPNKITLHEVRVKDMQDPMNDTNVYMRLPHYA